MFYVVGSLVGSYRSDVPSVTHQGASGSSQRVSVGPVCDPTKRELICRIKDALMNACRRFYAEVLFTFQFTRKFRALARLYEAPQFEIPESKQLDEQEKLRDLIKLLRGKADNDPEEMSRLLGEVAESIQLRWKEHYPFDGLLADIRAFERLFGKYCEEDRKDGASEEALLRDLIERALSQLEVNKRKIALDHLGRAGFTRIGLNAIYLEEFRKITDDGGNVKIEREVKILERLIQGKTGNNIDGILPILGKIATSCIEDENIEERSSSKKIKVDFLQKLFYLCLEMDAFKGLGDNIPAIRELLGQALSAQLLTLNVCFSKL